jgi:hypothetical protein
MNFPNKEQRKENRVDIQFPAWISWTDNAGREIVEEAFTMNVSECGVSLQTRQRVPVGLRVKVTLRTAGLYGSSYAEIKWVEDVIEGYRMGVNFSSDIAQGKD